MRPRALTLALSFSLALACSSEARNDVVWDPYDGAAYPSTRARVELPAGDFALVPASGSDTLSVVDLGKGSAIAKAPVGRSAFVLDGPHQVVADPSRRVAYAVLAYPGALEAAGNHSHGSSQRSGWVQALAWDDLRPVGEVRVDPNPGEIAVSEDGKRLVVTHFDLAKAADLGQPIEARRATVAVLDPAAMLPSGTPEPDKLLACVAPHGLALSRPDGRTAFVACYGEAAVALLDLADVTTPVTLVPTGANPYGVALSPDGTRLAMGTREGKDVRFLDVASRALEPLVVAALGETYVPTWSPDGARVYVPTRDLDAVAIVDAKSGATLTKRVFDPAECAAPVEIARGSDPGLVVLVCEGTASVPGAMLVLDAATLVTRSRAEIGFFPGRPFVGRGP